jgi:phospholipid/cholesterol/gamma-HCH transport system ATP-binding protein
MSPTTDTPQSHVALEHVDMAFEEREVFRNLSCSFERSKISVILGGSGAGKSTVLRLIAGLVYPRKGRILIDGDDITRLSERQMYGVRNKLGMMFQGGALLDSMSVFDNLAFPLREHTKMKESEIAEAVHDRLRAVGLSDVDTLLPSQLSGGMRKRVALARAIMRKPVILLCDEPFSGLDPLSTRRIEGLLEDINHEYRITIVAVSHHIPSTMRMASQVLVLLPDGAVQGTPDDLRRSTDPRIASFLADDVDESVARSADVESLPGTV